jgi:hypothetical protein
MTPTVAEGVVLSVVYQDADGKSVGMTRLNDARAVSAQSGNWNIDAYARVTRDFLIITRPQRKDMGPLVIPASRLVSIQFGDGGIQHVDTSRTRSDPRLLTGSTAKLVRRLLGSSKYGSINA